MQERSLKPFWLGLVLMTAGVLLIWWSFSSRNDESAAVVPTDDATTCIQVITPAKNLETGETRDFPTPCDVPAGWVITSTVVE